MGGKRGGFLPGSFRDFRVIPGCEEGANTGNLHGSGAESREHDPAAGGGARIVQVHPCGGEEQRIVDGAAGPELPVGESGPWGGREENPGQDLPGFQGEPAHAVVQVQPVQGDLAGAPGRDQLYLGIQ